MVSVDLVHWTPGQRGVVKHNQLVACPIQWPPMIISLIIIRPETEPRARRLQADSQLGDLLLTDLLTDLLIADYQSSSSSKLASVETFKWNFSTGHPPSRVLRVSN